MVKSLTITTTCDYGNRYVTSFVNELSKLKSDIVIIAWGSIGEGSKKITGRQEELLEKLKPFRNKMYVICDPYRSIPMHPLCPRIKNQWRLVKMYKE